MRRGFSIVGFLVILVMGITACSVLSKPEEASAPVESVPVESVGGASVFEIDQAGSEVRFELDEDLRGNRITVIGKTDQVAGEISTDYNDLSATQVGTITIDARTLATDNDFRNRALQNQILDTGSFEFITFEPKNIEGLPASASAGETLQFTIVGDLTIKGITKEVTFTVDATAVSETQITGTASATVMRSDFGLNIPSVQNVANVEEEVELYIDFTANAS